MVSVTHLDGRRGIEECRIELESIFYDLVSEWPVQYAVIDIKTYKLNPLIEEQNQQSLTGCYDRYIPMKNEVAESTAAPLKPMAQH